MNFREPQPIRLVIADDHPIFRDGLRRLLEREPDLKVLGEAMKCLKFAAEASPSSPWFIGRTYSAAILRAS